MKCPTITSDPGKPVSRCGRELTVTGGRDGVFELRCLGKRACRSRWYMSHHEPVEAAGFKDAYPSKGEKIYHEARKALNTGRQHFTSQEMLELLALVEDLLAYK